MLSGGPANAISFMIPLAGLGDSYSLVAANFRTGDPPPAGRDEMLLAVDSPANEDTTLDHGQRLVVSCRFCHTQQIQLLALAPITLRMPLITVNPFVEAWTNAAGFSIVPQQGVSDKIQTLGDKIMTPVVYQNIGGTESLWADQTVMAEFPDRADWYSLVSIRCHWRHVPCNAG